jgi:hypothetical protein
MLMFQADYLTRLMEMGEEDAEARAEEIAAFIEPSLPSRDVRAAPAARAG